MHHLSARHKHDDKKGRIEDKDPPGDIPVLVTHAGPVLLLVCGGNDRYENRVKRLPYLFDRRSPFLGNTVNSQDIRGQESSDQKNIDPFQKFVDEICPTDGDCKAEQLLPLPQKVHSLPQFF